MEGGGGGGGDTARGHMGIFYWSAGDGRTKILVLIVYGR